MDHMIENLQYHPQRSVHTVTLPCWTRFTTLDGSHDNAPRHCVGRPKAYWRMVSNPRSIQWQMSTRTVYCSRS